MKPSTILECAGVGKRYGRHTVLQEIGFSLEEGEVFGFLGPNGAGKTTLIKIFLGLVTPTAGEITIFGRDLFAERRRIMREVGAIVEAPVFPGHLTAVDNLRSLVSLNGPVEAERIDEVLAMVGLASVADQRVQTFSYGMKQRLGIAQALLPRNRLVFLDEPTNGLDPHGIAGMRRLIRDLTRRLGVTVFLSSHLLQEIEQVCDRVMIIDRGREVFAGRIDEIVAAEATTVIVDLERGAETLGRVAALGGRPNETEVEAAIGLASFVFELSPARTPELVKALVEGGERVVAVRPCQPTLEELFLRQTRKGSDDVRSDAF